MSSQTFSLSGVSSELECHFFPPIEVGNKSEIGLLSMQTYNSIPNVRGGCDTLHIIQGGKEETAKIKIPTGCYEIIALENKMRELLKSVGVRFFSLSTDNSTLKCTVHCSSEIDLNVEDSIAPLLGFDKRTLARDRRHESDRVVKIMNVNTIKIECNLALGSFDNGLQSHTIHEFYPVVPPGYKIVEIPKYCVLYKLKTNTIDYVRVSLTDQNGKAIDFREGKITKPAELTTGITIAHNGLTNLFNEMKYEINSTEVQRVKGVPVGYFLRSKN
ncbi:hypothetical protein QTP88_000974 [Uroleucon formosanum]